MSTLLQAFQETAVTLYHDEVEPTRELYEALGHRLYPYFEAQSRSGGQYTFASDEGASLVLHPDRMELSYFLEQAPSPPDPATLREILALVHQAYGEPILRGIDHLIASEFPVRELNGGKVNYISADEFLATSFLRMRSFQHLGGSSTGVGIRFFYDRQVENLGTVHHDLRLEPSPQDRRSLLVDLMVQYGEEVSSLDLLARCLGEDLAHLRTAVPEFLRASAAEGKGT